MPGGQCHPCGSCVKCHLRCHATTGTKTDLDVDEACLVTADFMAEELHGLTRREYRNTGLLESCWVGIVTR